jgi:hypothetical protein
MFGQQLGEARTAGQAAVALVQRSVDVMPFLVEINSDRSGTSAKRHNQEPDAVNEAGQVATNDKQRPHNYHR